LISGIAAGTNFYVSLGILIGTIGLFTWLTYYIFNKRDIK
jgi:ABC-type transport system involved in multi-copper enzyme maturation permease subunit